MSRTPSPEIRSVPTVRRSRRARAVERAIGRTYSTNEQERELLRTVGRFRVVEEADLAQFVYAGDRQQYSQDRARLVGQGLLKRSRTTARKRVLEIVALTVEGRKFLYRIRETNDQQEYFAGAVKTREMAHDASIYRMYQEHKKQIEAAGGKVQRVVLDYELKREIYRRMAGAGKLPVPQQRARREQVADKFGLRVVDDRIPLPDLRIEFERAGGDQAKVDLEAVSHNYHAHHMALKASAGFRLWSAAGGTHSGGAPYDPDLLSEVFDL